MKLLTIIASFFCFTLFYTYAQTVYPEPSVNGGLVMDNCKEEAGNLWQPQEIGFGGNFGIVLLQKAYGLENSYLGGGKVSFRNYYSGAHYWDNYLLSHSLNIQWIKANEPLNSVFTVNKTAEIQFINTKHFSLRSEMGIGMAYVHTPWNSTENYYNSLIGSKINAFIPVYLSVGTRLLPKMPIRFKIGFVHVSNAEFAKPNDGLNYLTYQFTVGYKLQEIADRTETSQTELNRIMDQFIMFDLVTGVKELKAGQPNKFWVSCFSASYNRNVFSNISAGLSVDVLYDTFNSLQYFSESGEALKLGLSVPIEGDFGLFSVGFQQGKYVVNDNQESMGWYNWVNLAYGFRKVKAVISYKRQRRKGYFIGLGGRFILNIE